MSNKHQSKGLRPRKTGHKSFVVAATTTVANRDVSGFVRLFLILTEN